MLAEFHCTREDEVIMYCGDPHGFLNQPAPIARKVIKNLENLRVVAGYGTGLDNIGINAATEKGIPMANAINDTTDAADHTVVLALSGEIPADLVNREALGRFK